MKTVIDTTKEIERLRKEKDKLIETFVDEMECISSQIKYLRYLEQLKCGIGGENEA